MPQRGSLDVKLTSWKLGSYIPLLGSESNKGPDFFIRGGRSVAGQGGALTSSDHPKERSLPLPTLTLSIVPFLWETWVRMVGGILSYSQRGTL